MICFFLIICSQGSNQKANYLIESHAELHACVCPTRQYWCSAVTSLGSSRGCLSVYHKRWQVALRWGWVGCRRAQTNHVPSSGILMSCGKLAGVSRSSTVWGEPPCCAAPDWLQENFCRIIFLFSHKPKHQRISKYPAVGIYWIYTELVYCYCWFVGCCTSLLVVSLYCLAELEILPRNHSSQ